MAKLCYQARRVGSERKAAGAGFFRTVVKEIGRLPGNLIVLSGLLILATEMEMVVGN
jgi:hypothetical protein